MTTELTPTLRVKLVRAYEDGADMTITVMEMQGDGVPDNPRKAYSLA